MTSAVSIPGNKMRHLLIIPLALVLVLNLSFAATSQEEDIEWSYFSFDTSSYSWQEDGEKGFNLQSDEYVTWKHIRSHRGDVVKMSGFNPDWIMLEIAGEKVFFSTDADNDGQVDEKARRVPGCVAVHYEDSHVAAFGGRTYTIQLLEGRYSLTGSYAEFAFHRGGTPTRQEVQPAPKKKSAEDAPKSIPGQIQTLKVIVKMPTPEEAPRLNKFDLTVEFFGPAHFLTRYLAVRPDGRRRTFTFHDIPAGTYNMEVTWANKDARQIVDVYENMSRIDVIFD
jgi:hypothetical protein